MTSTRTAFTSKEILVKYKLDAEFVIDLGYDKATQLFRNKSVTSW